jgi:hypothetical protein
MMDSKRMANKRVQATLCSAPNPRRYMEITLANATEVKMKSIQKIVLTIRIYKDNSVHSFDISGGAVCDRTQWPVGVRDLVEHEEALVNKYQ